MLSQKDYVENDNNNLGGVKKTKLILETPMYINWNYTYRCNFSCNHCYSRAVSYPKELSTKEYLFIAKQFIENEIFWVNLGGGEPLLRNDYLQIISYLTNNGVKVNLSTNGWRINEKILKDLKNSGLRSLYVSLDHIEAKKHDEFRNKNGSYEKVIRSMHLAKDYHFEVFISTVITRDNINIIEKIVEFAEKNNINGIDFKRLRPQGVGFNNYEKYQIPIEKEKDLFNTMLRLKRESKINIYFPFSEDGIEGLDYGCPCGRLSLAVRPNGDVSVCVYNQQVIGNLLKDDLKELWQKSPELIKLRNNFSCVGGHS